MNHSGTARHGTILPACSYERIVAPMVGNATSNLNGCVIWRSNDLCCQSIVSSNDLTSHSFSETNTQRLEREENTRHGQTAQKFHPPARQASVAIGGQGDGGDWFSMGSQRGRVAPARHEATHDRQRAVGSLSDAAAIIRDQRRRDLIASITEFWRASGPERTYWRRNARHRLAEWRRLHQARAGRVPGRRGAGEGCRMIRILAGNCRDILPTLAEESVQAIVTSPPYYGLRSYLDASHPDKHREIGGESTPAAYVATMVAVMRQVWRVLRRDGTAWLNVGDSYNGYMANQRGTGLETNRQQARAYIEPGAGLRTATAKNKDLLLIPSRLAIALQDDGWWIRARHHLAQDRANARERARSPDARSRIRLPAHEVGTLLLQPRRCP